MIIGGCGFRDHRCVALVLRGVVSVIMGGCGFI